MDGSWGTRGLWLGFARGRIVAEAQLGEGFGPATRYVALRGGPRAVKGSRLKELTDLLGEMFTRQQLRHFLRTHYSTIEKRVGGDSPEAYAASTVEALHQERILDGVAFYDHLVSVRTNRRVHIDALRVRIRGEGTSALPPNGQRLLACFQGSPIDHTTVCMCFYRAAPPGAGAPPPDLQSAIELLEELHFGEGLHPLLVFAGMLEKHCKTSTAEMAVRLWLAHSCKVWKVPLGTVQDAVLDTSLHHYPPYLTAIVDTAVGHPDVATVEWWLYAFEGPVPMYPDPHAQGPMAVPKSQLIRQIRNDFEWAYTRAADLAGEYPHVEVAMPLDWIDELQVEREVQIHRGEEPCSLGEHRPTWIRVVERSRAGHPYTNLLRRSLTLADRTHLRLLVSGERAEHIRENLPFVGIAEARLCQAKDLAVTEALKAGVPTVVWCTSPDGDATALLQEPDAEAVLKRVYAERKNQTKLGQDVRVVADPPDRLLPRGRRHHGGGS